METTIVQNEKLPGFIDLIRIILVIALIGFMVCLESSAQVSTKTCCNHLQHIDKQWIVHFMEFIDSLDAADNEWNNENLFSPRIKNKEEINIERIKDSRILDEAGLRKASFYNHWYAFEGNRCYLVNFRYSSLGWKK